MTPRSVIALALLGLFTAGAAVVALLQALVDAASELMERTR